MVTVRHAGRPRGTSAARVVRRRWHGLVRRMRTSALTPALLLCVTSVLLGVGMHIVPMVFPLVTLVIPMVVGSLVLGPRLLPWVVLFNLGVLVSVVLSTRDLLNPTRIGGVVVIFVIGLVILLFSFRRSALGIAGMRGESMLVDLRDRIHHQAAMPALPDGWYAEAVMRSAGASPFAGDFIVGSLARDGRSLQVAVVDVSGKGEQAGSRSLLLSGAFGGLLGALEPSAFLPTANEYLLRQDWSEGFATAVHVALDLHTGRFELRSAGHPPGVQLLAGSGRWAVHETEGPVLGLIPDADFSVVHGCLNPGDALLLFTDGLVENPQRDISSGIDKLLGQGERLLRSGFDSGAHRLIDRLESLNDDRALLLLHRR